MKLNELMLTEDTKPTGTAKKLLDQINNELSPLFKDYHFSARILDVIPDQKYSIRVEFARAKQDDRTAIGQSFSTDMHIGAFGSDGEPYPGGRFSLSVFMGSKYRKELKAMTSNKETTPEKAVKRTIAWFKKNADALKGKD